MKRLSRAERRVGLGEERAWEATPPRGGACKPTQPAEPRTLLLSEATEMVSHVLAGMNAGDGVCWLS